MRPARTIVTLLLVALFMATGWQALQSPNVEAVSRSELSLGSETGATRVGTKTGLQESTLSKAAAPDDRAGRAMIAAAKLKHRDALVARDWSKSDPDKLTFVRSLLPAARSGDTDTQEMIAAVLDGCENWKMPLHDGKTWHEKLKDPRWQAGKWLRLDVEDALARCDPLTAASPEEVGSAATWRASALAGGNGQALIGEAEDADNGLQPEERVKLFKRVVSDADPAALTSIIANTPEYRAAMDKSEKEDWLGQIAIRDLAMCQLGNNCSPTGGTLKLYCFSEDCRGVTSLHRYFELHLTPQQFTDAQSRAQYFADRFLGGGDQWPEAQAYEQSLRQVTSSSK